MNNKGFSLIELLAVLLLIAILSLVTIPKISEIIDAENINSYIISTNNLKNGAKEKALTFTGIFKGYECYIVNESGCEDLKLSGQMPTSAKIKVFNDGTVNVIAVYGNKCFYINEDESAKEADDLTVCILPEISKVDIDIQDNNLKATITMESDSESIVKYSFSIDGKNWYDSSKNSYTFENIESGNYTLYTKAYNKNNLAVFKNVDFTIE
jgi:prepilin-type N-terminal cleavage/methylation domain-containing protein